MKYTMGYVGVYLHMVLESSGVRMCEKEQKMYIGHCQMKSEVDNVKPYDCDSRSPVVSAPIFL